MDNMIFTSEVCGVVLIAPFDKISRPPCSTIRFIVFLSLFFRCFSPFSLYHRTFSLTTELGLENKYQGYYATKMALWCYLISDWDINNLKVNPNLTGVELQRAQKILAAAKDIYARGTAWNEMLSPEVTCTPDRDTAYEVTIDGKQYKQQVFTFWSKTWVCDYSVNVAFSVPDDVPDGTRIVDMNNQDMHPLIEVIADDPDTLEQRVTAVETLCVASDMLAKRCEYKHEAAFLSFLPLLISDPDIERKSRRNALTSGVAASFPFASFELSDQKGIFLGLNLYNRSPVFIDLYDDYKYTNGNFAAFGNSGAGKSTLLQSIGKRLREQQRKVIYIAPEKGHE